MSNKPSRDDDDFTKSEDLMESLTYGIRKLYFSGSWIEAAIGVMLDESPDSFLVGLPAIVSIEDTKSILSAMNDMPYMRFMKADIRAVSFVEGIHRDMYLEYLAINSPKVFPEIMEIIGEEPTSSSREASNKQMYEDMSDLSIQDELDRQDALEENQENVRSALSAEEVPAGILIHGLMTEEEVRDTVENAIDEGRFLPPTGKLPN